MGRPKGSTNKIPAGKVIEICEDEGICIVRKQIRLALDLEADGKKVDAARIYQGLMPYAYARKMSEDANGKSGGGMAEEIVAMIGEEIERRQAAQ